MHFSEMIELQFGKECHTVYIALYFKTFYINIVDSLSSQNAWLPPISFLDFNSTC